MITQFPTPLPGEMWYSVLTRYHLRSGFATAYDSFRELGVLSPRGKLMQHIISPYPTLSMYNASLSLPYGVLDLEKLVLENTLFPYTTRFFPYDEKRALLDDFLSGRDIRYLCERAIVNQPNANTLRLCPECCREDREKYGEAYWHIEHQIPLMPLCPKHGCRLETPEKCRRLVYINSACLYPDEGIEMEADYYGRDYEWELSAALSRMQSLPLDTEPNFTNIARALTNKSLAHSFGSPPRFQLDFEKTYAALLDRFGSDLVVPYFMSGKKYSMSVAHGERTAPEKYALLAVLADVPIDVVFSEVPVPLKEEEALREAIERLAPCPISRVGQELGLNYAQTKKLIWKYNIPRFWPPSAKELLNSERSE